MPALQIRDLNMEVAGQLYDMAIIHPSRYGRIAYKRAAQSVLGLEEPLGGLLAQQDLRELPYIGPATERIILEYLKYGESPTVLRAVEKSGKGAEVEAAHAHRTNFLSRAGALGALRGRAKGAVKLGDYQGDLQMHTEWSDGAESISQMASAAMARGYSYIGVSDHSYGLKIASGMAMKDAVRQHREIDKLNEEWGGSFRVFKGIEANIPAEGGVDMTPAELARFETCPPV